MNKNQNVEVPAGDTPTIVISIEVADGTTFDPAGATGVFWVAKTSSSTGADIFIKKSTADSPTPTASFNMNATTGAYELWAPLLEADTAAVAAGSYYHEALIIEASGTRSHIMTGQFKVLATPNA